MVTFKQLDFRSNVNVFYSKSLTLPDVVCQFNPPMNIFLKEKHQPQHQHNSLVI